MLSVQSRRNQAAAWIAEFERLKKVNAEIVGAKGGKPAPKRKQTKSKPVKILGFIEDTILGL